MNRASQSKINDLKREIGYYKKQKEKIENSNIGGIIYVSLTFFIFIFFMNWWVFALFVLSIFSVWSNYEKVSPYVWKIKTREEEIQKIHTDIREENHRKKNEERKREQERIELFISTDQKRKEYIMNLRQLINGSAENIINESKGGGHFFVEKNYVYPYRAAAVDAESAFEDFDIIYKKLRKVKDDTFPSLSLGSLKEENRCQSLILFEVLCQWAQSSLDGYKTCSVEIRFREQGHSRGVQTDYQLCERLNLLLGNGLVTKNTVLSVVVSARRSCPDWERASVEDSIQWLREYHEFQIPDQVN